MFGAQPQQQASVPQKITNFLGGLFGAKPAQQQHQQQVFSAPSRPGQGSLSLGGGGFGGQRIKEKPGKYKQEVDTNVFQVQLSCLKDSGELATGDPVFCTQCQAVFNKFSKIEETKDAATGEVSQVWKCEFCLKANNVQFEPEELPKTAGVNYIVEAAAQIHDKKGGAKGDVSVVFCVDISGSMCVSQAIHGYHKIKGERMTQQLKSELMKYSDGSDQRLQGDHGVTYVSRLQCVQSAIDSQLEAMHKNNPDRKIGLVTFNNEVTIIGDGTQAP